MHAKRHPHQSWMTEVMYRRRIYSSAHPLRFFIQTRSKTLQATLCCILKFLACSRQEELITMADNTQSNQKTYHKKPTGEALVTAKRHSKDHELKLYGSCFWYIRP